MYTTQTNVEQALGRTLTTDEAAHLTSVLLPGITAYINQKTNTLFGSDDEVEIVVSGCGSSRLIIPTMWEVSSVELDGSPVDSASWKKYPSTGPYLALTKIDGIWAEGQDNYVVKGKLGYQTVSSDITSVATQMAVTAFSSKKENGASIKSEKVGDYSVTYGIDEGAASSSLIILNNYNRLSRSI